jgi:hypothetical protein
MAGKKPKASVVGPPRIDYARLPANLYAIAGDFVMTWVKEKPLPRGVPIGYYSEMYPRGDGRDDKE